MSDLTEKTNKGKMKFAKIIGLVLLLVLVVIQFIRPARNVSDKLLPTDITLVAAVPENIHKILTRSCYDCHSNNTSYPWYMTVQPAAWYLADHIREGKHELNFSDFGSYPAKRQLKKLQEIAKEVEEGEMPLSSYTLIHRDARLSPDEKSQIIAWANGLASKY